MVITGDPTQVDLGSGVTSGLAHAVGVLAEVKGVGIARLASEDVVRHPLVALIVDAYERPAPGPGAGPRADRTRQGQEP